MKRVTTTILLFLCLGVFVSAGCTTTESDIVTFILSIANVGPVHTSSGVFDTPAGETDPSPIGPGQSYEFQVSAVEGEFLSFATMMVQSNDKFYAPQGTGIELFPGGVPFDGAAEDQIYLWDAGTEVDQEPGVGEDQAPRQSGPDTGADENGVVGLADDGFTYPDVNQVLELNIDPISMGTPTAFQITILNVSDASTLSTSLGSVEVPLAPGAWVLHTADDPLFMDGLAASGDLEALAEDGDASLLGDTLMALSGLVSPIAPGVWALTTLPDRIFTQGLTDFGEGLEALAEDGDPSGLESGLTGKTGVAALGIFDTPAGGSTGPAFSGYTYQIQFEAEQGQYLTFATMLVQSNDLFYSPTDAGIALFSGSDPISGNITSQIRLWDAGTEVNEEPGFGPNQPLRQTGPDTGTDEGGVVQLIGNVNDGYTYPTVANILEVTLTVVN